MAGSAHGQYFKSKSFSPRLVTRTFKMYLALLGLPITCMSLFRVNTLLTKLMFSQDGGILASFCFFFCCFFGVFIDLAFGSVQKHANKKEHGQCPAILISHLTSNPYIQFLFLDFQAEALCKFRACVEYCRVMLCVLFQFLLFL